MLHDFAAMVVRHVIESFQRLAHELHPLVRRDEQTALGAEIIADIAKEFTNAVIDGVIERKIL